MSNSANVSEGLQVEIIVVRANQLPSLNTNTNIWFKRKRKFYVTAADGSARATKGTKAVRSVKNAVNWNEKLDGLHVQSSSHITMSLYAKDPKSPDSLIGTVEIDPVSKAETSFTLESDFVPAPIIVLTIFVHARRRPNVSIQPSAEERNRIVPASLTQDLQQQVQDVSENAEIAVKNMRVLDDWKGTIRNVRLLMGMVETLADVHPIAKLAWNIISPIPEAFMKQVEIDTSVQDLVKVMRATIDLTNAKGLLQVIKPNSNQAFILKVMLTHITTCGEAVQCYAKNEKFRERFFHNIMNSTDDKIKDLCDTLVQLRQDFLNNAVVDAQTTVHDIQKSMEIFLNETSDMAFDIKLNDLPYHSGWSSTVNKNRCLEGTRAHFIEYITKWIQNPSSKRGLILYGQLGAGKSSIAFEIASRFYLEGSYFSFSRAKQLIEDHHLVTTIIRDMADRYPVFKREVGRLIAKNVPLRTSDNIDQLFNILLMNPLEKAGRTDIPNVIVIDALDESKHPKKLAQFLSQSLAKLPSNVRVLITSRPEISIHPAFPHVQEAPYDVLHITDSTLSVDIDNDIRLYFQTYLKGDVFQKEGERLVKEAGGLFQWAAVALGFINDPPAGYTTDRCLRGLLGQDIGDKEYTQELHSLKLYTLYAEVLSAYFILGSARLQFLSIIGHLLCAFEPLSIKTLIRLRHYMPNIHDNDESVPSVMTFMGSLLSNVTSEDRDLPVVPLHTSFRDFLVDRTNTHSFSLNLLASHTDLTQACLDLMLHELQFNICKLESSHLRNADVGDLQMRVDKFISPSLFYACRFWDDHLDCITFNITIFNKLDRFVSTKLLFWLEVLSVTKTVPMAIQAIHSMLKWLKKDLCTANPEIEDKVRALVCVVVDALAFVRSFGGAIATSAPHIYVSALPFTPKSSEVYKAYPLKIPGPLSFIRGQLDYWPALEMSIATSQTVSCVDFSPDGQWIASGMYDGTICLWNATTGIQEGPKFTGHTSRVKCISFSSDGQHMISGSEDHTICLWNLATCTMAGNPWIGHGGTVIAIAFSPDGAYVVSGSDDGTIRLWNVANGSMESIPLSGNNFGSVAFSSDGEWIVSSSYDASIRVWKFDNAKGRVEVIPLLTLQAPGPLVLCVAISPNGQQIAAGCENYNIYLWNALTEPTEGNPLIGHRDLVVLVKFSPDGRYLVSAGYDGKLRLWNTSTSMVEGLLLSDSVISMALSSDGQRIVSADPSTINVWDVMAATSVVETRGALTRHTSAVMSVAYSDVGEQHLVASGFRDGTICLWDVKAGINVGSPLRGHTDSVYSIAFSSNGQQLVSGSLDRTVRVWNVAMRTMEGSPLTGHNGYVHAVAFSPDGQWIVSGCSDGGVFLWNTRGMQQSALTGCSDSISSVDFSPDSLHVVSGTERGAIWIWDVSMEEKKAGRQLGQHEEAVEVLVVSFINNDRIISCNRWGTVHYWKLNTSTGKMDDAVFNLGCEGHIISLSLSPDRSRIAAGFNDCTIVAWNLATRTEENLGPMTGHIGCINTLAFSSDGQQLVSGSDDATIRVWDISGKMNASPEPSQSHDINLAKLDKNGWLVGKQEELLVWIPQHYRPTCRRPKNLIALFPHHLPHLNFSTLVHRDDWHSVY